MYCLIAYIQCRYVLLVLRLVTRSVLLLNTLISYYQKLFGSLNPPRFSIIRKRIINENVSELLENNCSNH